MKEADALKARDYSVTVIAADVNERLSQLDVSIIDSRAWRVVRVTKGSWISYALRTLIQRATRLLLSWLPIDSLWLAKKAHHRLTSRIAAAATLIRADIYIAHHLAALPAAAYAAKKHGAKLGFDAEDFHTEELAAEKRDSGDQIARRIIESKLLARCSHRTAAAPLIAKAYRDKYDVNIATVLNVFPLSEAPENTCSKQDRLNRSLYWFSQTIGSRRGLEEMLEAMALMPEPPTLYLRGNPAKDYLETLLSFAERLGLQDKIVVLPAAPPDQMVRLAQCYSLGLAVEPGSSPNNDMALSNKIFAYLLAGLPVLMSRTPAQEQLAQELDDAAILVDLKATRSIANTLERFFADSDLQRRARDRAWRVARQRFNWDREQEVFIDVVVEALAAPRSIS